MLEEARGASVAPKSWLERLVARDGAGAGDGNASGEVVYALGCVRVMGE